VQEEIEVGWQPDDEFGLPQEAQPATSSTIIA
jgi:hypothetical protein